MRPISSFALVTLVAFGAAYLARPDPKWDPILEPYVAFVEETRGLEFTSPVDVVRGDVAAELSAADDEATIESTDELPYDPYAEATRLLGLTGAIANYADAYGDVREAGAAAFYDPSIATIVLPEGPVDLSLELTIVHELTHALQDQHGLLAYGATESWSSAAFRTALIEGDASIVENAWFETLSAADRDALAAEAPEGSVPDGFLESTFLAPYALGPPVVTTVIADGGYDALDRMLRLDDLGSDERLLDPLSSSGVPKFKAEASIVDPDGNQWFDGWMGAFGWYHAIAPSVGAEGALEAIRGYDNDVFVVFERDGVVCSRFDVWFDTRNDATEFADAVRRWDVLIELIDPSRTTVRIDICEPVGNPAAQVTELLAPLVIANWMTVEHQQHTDLRSVIRCASHRQAAAEGFVDGHSIDWERLAMEAAGAREACEPT